jgi:cytochrome bd-type quinol oxidase subunit 2
MREKQEINSVSGVAMLLLSFTALLAVLSGYTQPPQTDEGTAAHIFQLSIVALVPMILLFLATADWRQPVRSARPLAFAVAALVLAFGALYYLEHFRNPNFVGGNDEGPRQGALLTLAGF